MKDKQTYLTKGSFALLLFVILGYVVKFFPEQLIPLDSSIQTAIVHTLGICFLCVLSYFHHDEMQNDVKTNV